MFYNKLIKNQKGMSLVEVMIATGMAVALSVSVMKVNQTAQKGVAASKASASVLELEANLKRKLSTPGIANDTYYAVGTGAGNRFTTGSGYQINSDKSLNMIKTPFNLSGDPELEVNSTVMGYPEWKVQSITMKEFNNGGSSSLVGYCNIEVILNKISTGNFAGGRDRKIIIPMTCTVNDLTNKRIQDIVATGEQGEEELYWKRNEDATATPPWLYLEHTGIGGTAKVKIGTGATIEENVIGALLVDPATDGSQDDPYGRPFGLQVPSGASINFGSHTTATSAANLYYGTSGSNTLDSDGSFHAADRISGGTKVVSPIGDFTTRVDAPLARLDDIRANIIRGSGGGTDPVGTIYVNNITISGSHSVVSDRRFKKDIEELSPSDDILNQVRPVSYYMRKDLYPNYNFDDSKRFGVIAQELREVLPDLVIFNKDLDRYTVNYLGFIPFLIKGHQEQSQDIKNNLEKFMLMKNGISRKIASIEAKNIELESRVQKLEDQNKALVQELKDIKAMLLELKD